MVCDHLYVEPFVLENNVGMSESLLQLVTEHAGGGGGGGDAHVTHNNI